MNNIFNSTFEVSLRILIILSEYQDTHISTDTIAAIDFISIYGAEFEISDTNLHGDNIFKFSEFTSRRTLIQQGVKKLVLQNLISVLPSEDGFTYHINNNGRKYINLFESNYAHTYKEMCHKARQFILNRTEKDVLKMINELSIYSLKKRGI
ncbi:ABC-three component system middle component 2 [Aquibacillus salsiterrae]|uniref:Uncharacterized protein n=1 Tax=Aquibacillus salsiterrae TaxID=2950439 RepID=A0A9X3WEA0_9BACI|nr:ABC-three component system middle component 2 [Aquibacillus salsiterrae]MDC3416595.1 hypothetical protein [Aquibacillus salsiterrae]